MLCAVVYLLTVETMWHIPSRNIKRIDVDSISSPSKIHYIPESVENNSINSENIPYY